MKENKTADERQAMWRGHIRLADYPFDGPALLRD